MDNLTADVPLAHKELKKAAAKKKCYHDRLRTSLVDPVAHEVVKLNTGRLRRALW